MALSKTEICELALSKIGNERLSDSISNVDTDDTSVTRECLRQYKQALPELVRMHTWNCTKERAQLVETVTLITDDNGVEYTYYGNLNGKAEFRDSGGNVSIRSNAAGTEWQLIAPPYVAATDTVSSTADIPPETGWSGVQISTITLTYDFGWEKEYVVPSDCLRPMYLTNTDEATTFFRPNVEWTIEADRIRTNYSPVYLLYIKQPDPSDMDSLFTSALITLLAARLAKPIAGDEQLGQNILNEFYSVVMPEARRVNGFEGKEAPIVDSDWLEATFTSPSTLGSS